MASETNGSTISTELLRIDLEQEVHSPTLVGNIAVTGLTRKVNKSNVMEVIKSAREIGLKTIKELEEHIEVSPGAHVVEPGRSNDNGGRSTNGSRPHEHSEAEALPTMIGEPGKVRLIPDSSQNGDKSKTKKMSLILPKRVNTNSVKGNILRTLFREDIHCSTNDPRMVAEEVMKHFNTVKSIKSKELVASTIDELIKSGHIVVARNGSEFYTAKVAENLIRIIDKNKKRKNLSKVISFNLGEKQSIVVDIKDIKEMSLEQLVLVRILQNTTYETSGISQYDSLRNFIDLIDHEDKEELQNVLDKLTADRFIALNGDNTKHLTPEGKLHILEHLGSIGSIKTTETIAPDNQEITKEVEEFYRQKGAIIFGPKKRGIRYQTVYAHDVPQQENLSAETLTKLERLDEIIQASDTAKLDAETPLLSLENKAETFQIVQKLHETTGWCVNAFLTSETKGFIPIVFTTNKEYDVEALTGSQGMVTHRFTLTVVGNVVSMTLNQNLTMKDIYDVKSLSDRLDAMYQENGSKSHELDAQTQHSRAVLHSGINGMVFLGNGRFAHFPGLTAPTPQPSTWLE